MAQDPYRYFRPEARNLLDQFAQGILELEKGGGSAAAVQRLLRLAHTLKGAARVVRQSAIAERAHAIEDALAPFRDCADGIARENIDAILAHLDEIGSQIVTLVPADGAAAAVNGKIATARSAKCRGDKRRGGFCKKCCDRCPRAIRADIADMDAVSTACRRPTRGSTGCGAARQAIEQVGHLADLLRAQLAPRGSAGARAGAWPAVHRAIARPRRSCAAKSAAWRASLDTAIAQIDRELRQLRDAAEEPAAHLGRQSVHRARTHGARCCARRCRKQVTFEGSGGDIRLDADVLGNHPGRADPDHPQRGCARHRSRRASAWRPASRAAGRVTVSVLRRGPKILFECRDDGRGIDLAAVRRVAVGARAARARPRASFTAEDLVRRAVARRRLARRRR